jgi:hypothetical protein
MSTRINYIPMLLDDLGNPTYPDYELEGEDTPERAVIEAAYNWETAAELRDGKLMLAKVEDTTEIPPEDEWEDIKNASEGNWNPGDPWRKWLGCVEVRLVCSDVPMPNAKDDRAAESGSGPSPCWAVS